MLNVGALSMQASITNKRKTIIDDLTQIDSDLQTINFENNEKQIRRLIDQRRQLLANYTSSRLENVKLRSSQSHREYTPSTVSSELIKKWCSRITLFRLDQQSFANPEFCNQVLDNILPETWNFNSDVMVFVAPPSDVIVAQAVGRHQRHIVVFDDNKCIDKYALSRHSAANIVVCHTITDVEIAFAKLQHQLSGSLLCLARLIRTLSQKQKATWLTQSGKANKTALPTQSPPTNLAHHGQETFSKIYRSYSKRLICINCRSRALKTLLS